MGITPVQDLDGIVSLAADKTLKEAQLIIQSCAHRKNDGALLKLIVDAHKSVCRDKNCEFHGSVEIATVLTGDATAVHQPPGCSKVTYFLPPDHKL